MTLEEYQDYLHKVEELKNNETLKSIQNMINEHQNIIDRYKGAIKTINDKTKEKAELEKIILSIKFNASEGYNLCRDLQNILKDINEAENKQKELKSLNKYAVDNKNRLSCMYGDILNNKIKELRSSLNLGRLGQLESKSA